VLDRPVTRLLAVTITVILVVAAAAQTVYQWQRSQAAAGQCHRHGRRLPGSNDMSRITDIMS